MNNLILNKGKKSIKKEYFNNKEELYKIEYSNGTVEWFENGNGLLHRVDGPAIINADGDKFWYKNGKLHRDEAPAVEWNDGDTEWYFDGLLHRENGPAVDFKIGLKKWYINGKLHRIGMPAAIYPRGLGGCEWYYKGIGPFSSEEDLFKGLDDEGKINYLFAIESD